MVSGMELIFIGSIYPKEILDNIIQEKSHADFAAHTFQMSLLDGLECFYSDLTVITSPVTSSYPKSNSIICRKNHGVLNNTSDIPVYFTGFINIPILKLITEFCNVRRALKGLAAKNKTLYIYALHSPFLLAAYTLRKRFDKVCVVVPDLPDYMSHNKGVLRRIMKAINKVIINQCIRKFSYFVLFTPLMREKLPLDNKKWITVEGMYASTEVPCRCKEDDNTILYTGIISSKYGVFDLIEAFRRIKRTGYKLWLCGSCPNEMEKLTACLDSDSRIKYWGMLSKDVVRDLQQRATLLVNPRHSNEEYTKYSFPSKTMEYLASGTPTLMCKLPAIPPEYLEHLFLFEDESIDAYSKRIVEICEMDNSFLAEHGQRARTFILTEKNIHAQVKRIVDMVEYTQK